MLATDLTDALDPETVHRIVLDNGLTVLVRRDATAPVVAIVTYVNAGYFDEADDVVGISHVLEHMYFKGTTQRGVGEIARQTKAAGGYLNAGTIYDHTSYYTVLPSSGFVAGLDVQFDAYANSLIDADELARELEVIIQEAKRKADTPGAVATETLYELLHDRHRIRRWRIGRERGLRALTREGLIRFYRHYYRPGNTLLVIVGDVDPAEAFHEVATRYGSLRAGEITRDTGPIETAPPGFRFREWGGDIGQSQVAFGWRTPGVLDPSTAGLDLLSSVLSSGRASRLYRAVREQQLASSVSAYNYTPTALGVFVIQAETQPEKAADAACAIWGQLRELREHDVSDAELTRSKRLFESRWVRRLETVEGQANYLAEWGALGDWRMGDEYLTRVLAVTGSDLRLLARRWLEPAQAAVVIYRPEKSDVVAGDAERMLAMLDATKPVAMQPVSLPATGGPAVIANLRPERVEANVRVYRTNAGVPVLVRQKEGALLHAGVFALGGPRDEPAERAGITSLLTRTAVKGTSRRTAEQIAEEGEWLGSVVSAAMGSESFGWMISVQARYGREAIELLADVAQHPTIPDDALDTERAIAVAELVALRDDMYRYPVRLATAAAWAGHPYGVMASGDEVTLTSITADQIRTWHRARFLAAPTVVALVGAGDPDALAAHAASVFGELRGGSAHSIQAPMWPTAVVQRVEQRDKAQTALAMLFPAPSRTDPARVAMSMIAGVASGLGGRFFDELREKQSLGYTVQAFSSERALAGTFVTYIATSPDKEERARVALLAEFAKLCELPITKSELEQAQMHAVGVHAIQQQRGGSVLGDLVDAWMFGRLAELDEYDGRVQGVTTGEMLSVARTYFDETRRVEGIIRGTGRAV